MSTVTENVVLFSIIFWLQMFKLLLLQDGQDKTEIQNIQIHSMQKYTLATLRSCLYSLVLKMFLFSATTCTVHVIRSFFCEFQNYIQHPILNTSEMIFLVKRDKRGGVYISLFPALEFQSRNPHSPTSNSPNLFYLDDTVLHSISYNILFL